MINKKDIIIGTKQDILDYIFGEYGLQKQNPLKHLITTTFNNSWVLDIEYQLEKLMTRKLGIGLLFFMDVRNLEDGDSSIPKVELHLRSVYVHVQFDAKRVCKIEKEED